MSSERTAAYQNGPPESGLAAIHQFYPNADRPLSASDHPQRDPPRHQNETKLVNFVVLFGASPGYPGAMKFHGPILDNLNNAIASARRLRGHPVYKDTLAYWNELIQEARRIQREPTYERADLLEAAIVSLEMELAERAN
jgi:hypothetical protein